MMEPIEFSLWRLRTPLPGGLVVEVVLDGHVVGECAVRAILRQRATPATEGVAAESRPAGPGQLGGSDRRHGRGGCESRGLARLRAAAGW